MKKCCVCRSPITNDDPAILFIGQAGDDKEVCVTCERKAEVLMEDGSSPDEIKESINYLYTCIKSAHDSEVASFLENIIEESSAVIFEAENKKATIKPMNLESANAEPVNTSKKRDYFSEKKTEAEENKTSHAGNFWISGMKTIAWFAFFGIIIGGITLATLVGQDNGSITFLIVVVSIIVAFLSVSMLMVFLNLAQDVSRMTSDILKIKQMLRKKNKM